jgi:hypothetical protein
VSKSWETGKAINHAQSYIKRGENETDEQLAARLYYAQMEVYSTYAGRDLDVDFNLIDSEARKGWLEMAHNWRK